MLKIRNVIEAIINLFFLTVFGHFNRNSFIFGEEN